MLKATTRMSQTQRRKHSARRHNPDRFDTRDKTGPTPQRHEAIETVRNRHMDGLLHRFLHRKEVIIPVLPHTFGNPQSEEFWSGMTKNDLYVEAADRKIKGRANMTKQELVSALVEYERGTSTARG